MRTLLRLCFLGLSLLTGTAEARRSFDWDEITPEDWAYHAPEDSAGRWSCILHEKVTFDERKLVEGKVYLTVYRRMRIRSSADRAWGDVMVPLFMNEQKVEKAYGRTVQPDGSEVRLDEDQIYERELIKVDKRRVKQTAFSIPGVTDDCIVEYAYRVKLPSALGVWPFQQDVPVRLGQLHWKLWLGSGLSSLSILLFGSAWNPTYVLLNCDSEVDIEQLPSADDCSEMLFTFREIPALAEEPYALPDVARKAQVHCYYGAKGSAKAYWDRRVVEYAKAAQYFCEDNSRVRKAAKQFRDLETDQEKIDSAYAWVQAHVVNLSYDTDVQDPRDNESVNDVLKHGYGHAFEINVLFFDLLRQLDIDVHVALLTDRTERLFVQEAKYWQFDHWIVAVRINHSDYRYYSPGDACLAAGQTRWQNEGVTVLVCGVVIDQFQAVPYSESDQNVLERITDVSLLSDGGAMAFCRQDEWGHIARETRLLCFGDDPDESEPTLSERLQDAMFADEVSELILAHCDEAGDPVQSSCRLRFAHPDPPRAQRWLVNPFHYMEAVENPFVDDVRSSPILFDYAHRASEHVNISLPEGWTVGTIPADTEFANWAGTCSIEFQANDSVVSVTRDFELKRAYFKPSQYRLVRDLYAARGRMSESAILLQR